MPVVPWEGGPAARGPRPTANFLPRCLDVEEQTFGVGLDVTTTKKGRQLFGGRKVHQRENLRSAYEKRALPYVGMGPPNG